MIPESRWISKRKRGDRRRRVEPGGKRSAQLHAARRFSFKSPAPGGTKASRCHDFGVYNVLCVRGRGLSHQCPAGGYCRVVGGQSFFFYLYIYSFQFLRFLSFFLLLLLFILFFLNFCRLREELIRPIRKPEAGRHCGWLWFVVVIVGVLCWWWWCCWRGIATFGFHWSKCRMLQSRFKGLLRDSRGILAGFSWDSRGISPHSLLIFPYRSTF